jgi:hypothetical protein
MVTSLFWASCQMFPGWMSCTELELFCFKSQFLLRECPEYDEPQNYCILKAVTN